MKETRLAARRSGENNGGIRISGFGDHVSRLISVDDPSPAVGHHEIPSGVSVAAKGAPAATAEAAHAPVRVERAEHVGNILRGDCEAELGGNPAAKPASICEF